MNKCGLHIGPAAVVLGTQKAAEELTTEVFT